MSDSLKDLGFEPEIQDDEQLKQKVQSGTDSFSLSDLGFEPETKSTKKENQWTDWTAKVASGGAFGMLPYLSGGIEAVGEAAGFEGAGGPIDQIQPKYGSTSIDDLLKAYERGYKREQATQADISERRPIMSLGAEIGGGMVTGGALARMAAPALESMPAVKNVVTPNIPVLGDLSKMGTMNFTQAAKAPSLLERTATSVINTAPLATGLGLMQPTQEVGLNMPERLQNVAIANAINIPLMGAVEAAPAAIKATKETGKYMWNAIPAESRAGITAGLEGIAPFSKKAKEVYESVNNRLVDFFSNKVIPEERKAYLFNLKNKNIELDTNIKKLEGELKLVNDELDRQKRIWSENQLSRLSQAEQQAWSTNRVLIEDRRRKLGEAIENYKKEYDSNMITIKDTLDKEYKRLKIEQDASIKEDIEFLDNHEPRRFDNKFQQTLLGLREKLGQGYDNFENQLAQKNIRFSVVDPMKQLETKLNDLTSSSLKTSKPDVEDLVQQTLDELDTFMGDGSIGYSEYKTLLNGGKDRTGKRIDPALRGIKDKAKGLPIYEKFRKIIDEFEDQVRERQVGHLDDIGEKELANNIKDLNKKYRDYKFYEEKFLNLSEKKTPTGEPIILENPSTRSRFAEAGKKGMLDDGGTGEGLAGESLINELAASENPEVRKLADDVIQYYNRYGILGRGRVKETDDMIGIKELLRKLNRNSNINTVNFQDLDAILPKNLSELGVANLADIAERYGISKNELLQYDRRVQANPNYLENPAEYQPLLDEIAKARKDIKHNFEDIPDIAKMNEEAFPVQEGLRNDIDTLNQTKIQVNNPQINDFLDKAVVGDKPLEDLQKDIRNLIISGNSDRNTGGLGTDVQVLKNLVSRIKKYASEYEANYGVKLDDDLKNMVDKLDAVEAKMSGSALISGSKGNVVAGPSALASAANLVAHTLAYLVPNKSIGTIKNIASTGSKALLEKAQNYKIMNSALKNYNMTVQDLRQADSVKRAAVLNSLMQDPTVRQSVKTWMDSVGIGEKDESK